MSAYEVFRSFYSEEEARLFFELLAGKEIDCKLDKTRVTLDKIFIGDQATPDFHLKLKPEDFVKANKAIDAEIEQRLAEVDPDYYLYSFTDAELKEIINKPDEWNNQDVILSRKILNDRGLTITTDELGKIYQARLTELERPEQEKTISVWNGYLLAILFGVVGIFYSLYMMTAKKVLPDGRKIFVYDKWSRDHFSIMLAISLAITFLVFIGLVKRNILDIPMFF